MFLKAGKVVFCIVMYSLCSTNAILNVFPSLCINLQTLSNPQPPIIQTSDVATILNQSLSIPYGLPSLIVRRRRDTKTSNLNTSHRNRLKLISETLKISYMKILLIYVKLGQYFYI